MIKIVRGNDVQLAIPFVEKQTDGTLVPIDTSSLTDVVITVEQEYVDYSAFTIPLNGAYTYSFRDNNVIIELSEKMPCGSYSIKISAKNAGVDISYHKRFAFAIVPYNETATYQNYIRNYGITLDTAIFIGPHEPAPAPPPTPTPTPEVTGVYFEII